MTFKELTVYKKAFQLAMEIFEESKKFPVEEKYSLTSNKKIIPVSLFFDCRRLSEKKIRSTFHKQKYRC
jgi:hypothetical protein